MKTSSNGRKFIEQFEGLILGAYDDHDDHIVHTGDVIHGTLTIGYGHTSSAGAPTVYVGQTITKEEADAILATDLFRVEQDVNRLVKVKLNQNQFDALVSFHFNTGALGKSSVLKYLNQANYKQASQALLLWNKAEGHTSAGLVRRRLAEKNLFEKNTIAVPATTSGGVIAAGGVVATQFPQYAPYIILGAIVLAGLVWVAIHFFNKGK